MNTPREYLCGVLIGTLLVRALFYALYRLWQAVDAPRKERATNRVIAMRYSRNE